MDCGGPRNKTRALRQKLESLGHRQASLDVVSGHNRRAFLWSRASRSSSPAAGVSAACRKVVHSRALALDLSVRGSDKVDALEGCVPTGSFGFP